MIDSAALSAMRQKIDEARRVEEEILGLDEASDKPDEGGVSPRFVSNCFRLNERGDGMLFAAIHMKRLVFVKKLSYWLYWAGNHWKIDEEDRHINAADEVAQHYESHAASLKDRIDELIKTDHRAEAKILSELVKKYKQRINKLRSLKGVKSCVDYAHRIGDDSISIIGEEIDQKPLLLACPNAVINLETGEEIESNPADYILNAVKTPWNGIEEPCPYWEKFFDEIHQGDPEVKRFVHSLLGYAITGMRTEHFLGCFIGEGRNGKGTMFETIRAILGNLSWSISPELLLEQRYNRSSAGPSPDLYSLMGRRMVIASETDEGARVSVAQIKRLTGGDTIKTRAPHDKFEINFRPSHKLFLYTNHPPFGLAKDYAMAKRLLYINYPLKFIDNPKEENERKRDPDLPAKLEEEASGILAWLVRGALIWRAEGGLNPPLKIRAAVDAQQKQDDVIFQFFDDSIDRAPAKKNIKFSELYTKFKTFYEETVSEDTRYLPSKKKFSQWFIDHDCKKEKIGGEIFFDGIAYKPIE